MIIEMLLSFILRILNTLLVFEVPLLPQEVHNYLDSFFGYLESGASVLANYVPLGYLLTLFGIIVAIDGAILLYKFVLWILKKIPMLGIE